MGNYFTKCYKFNNKENDLFENLVNNFDEELDYDTNMEGFEKDIIPAIMQEMNKKASHDFKAS